MLHIDEKLLEMDEVIDDLVLDLLDSDEVRNYHQRRADFLSDVALQEKIRELNKNAQHINYRPELRELKKQVNLNDKVYQLRLAENDLQELLSSVTKLLVNKVSEHIFIDENLPLKGGNHHQRRKRRV